MCKFKNLFIVLLYSFLLVAALGGCATVEIKNKEPEQLYKEGLKSLEGRSSLFFFHVTDYEKARGLFEEIKSKYSYTTFAPLAELRLSDISFEREEYDEAIVYFGDFLRLHPDHEDVSYAIYKIGLSYFNQIQGVDRDQTPAEKALIHFQKVTDQFPLSEYSKDSLKKINFCKDIISRHEYYVGNFYYKRENYKGAAKRFISSLEKFAGFGPKEEALLYLAKSYLASKDVTKGIETLERLTRAFPESLQAAEAKELLNSAKGEI